MVLLHIFGKIFISEFHPIQILMPFSFPSSVLIIFNTKQIRPLMKKMNRVLQSNSGIHECVQLKIQSLRATVITKFYVSTCVNRLFFCHLH